MHVFFITILLLFNSFSAFTEDDYTGEEAWEPEDVRPFYSFHTSGDEGYVSLPKAIGKNLIRFYQKKISVKSISRCPFDISCSRFALKAIERYGLFIGILFFIDRNFYREHKFAFLYYPLIENEDFILLLDDHFYLE